MTPTFTACDPRTGVINWSAQAADVRTVDDTVARARAAFPGWAAIGSDQGREHRRAIAHAYADAIKARRADLAAAIMADTGKPLWEAEAEVRAMIGKVALSIAAEDERRPTRVMPMDQGNAVLRAAPHGVCVVLGPYNFPGHLPNGHIVPAVLAGNTVIFKPSELTPLTAQVTQDCWAAVGVPEGVVNIVFGGRETGEALVNHHGIDGVFFTGSDVGGKAIMRTLADRPRVILALEMGGDNPLVCQPPVDPESAALVIVQSAFLSAGQRCTCARRLILPAGKTADAVLAATVALIDRLDIGPDSEAPFMGPLISNAAADGVLAAQEKLIASGAVAVRRAKRLIAGRPWLMPGIIDVTNAAARPQREVFGPLLQIIRVSSFVEALAVANDTRFGLAAGLLCDDAARWRMFLATIRAGVVNWNRPLTGASSALPFGGVGDSGNHRPAAAHAADYCAYPLASMEAESAMGTPLPIGIRPP